VGGIWAPISRRTPQAGSAPPFPPALLARPLTGVFPTSYALTVERRAYYVHPNQARIAAGKRPKWVRPSVADGMKPIVVLPTQGAVTNLPPELPAYAVVTKEGREFTLYRPTESEATFDLPVYAETSGTPTRIVLTPFAIAGDTVMVGAVAAGVGFLLWLQIGAPTH
jgi:hypothetical protein